MVCRRSQSQKSGPKARSCWHNCHPFLNTGGQCVLWHSGELWSRVRLVVSRSSPIHPAYQPDTLCCKVTIIAIASVESGGTFAIQVSPCLPIGHPLLQGEYFSKLKTVSHIAPTPHQHQHQHQHYSPCSPIGHPLLEGDYYCYFCFHLVLNVLKVEKHLQ